MVFKFLTSVAILAVAQAGVIQGPYAAPVHYAPQPLVAKVAAPYALKQVEAEQYDPHPQYSYGYEVQDGVTGDSKSQQETRDGDSVQGSYSLIDADGFKRTVHYTADSVHGFNAVVQREPLAHKAVVAKAVSAPVAYAAPAAFSGHGYSAPVAYSGHSYAAPVAYSGNTAPLAYAAPVAKLAYSTPVSYSSAPVVAKSYSAPVAYSAYH